MALLIAAGLFCAANAQANLVQNGDFENWDSETAPTVPDFWFLTGTYTGPAIGLAGDPVNSGTLAIKSGDWLDPLYYDPGTVSQTISGTSSAKLYNIEFWLKNGTGTEDETGGDISVFVEFGTTTGFSAAGMQLTGWEHYSFQARGLDGYTTLYFEFRNDPTWFFLDDVSVTEVTTVPDGGATAGLMAFAALGLAGLSPWRRRS